MKRFIHVSVAISYCGNVDRDMLSRVISEGYSLLPDYTQVLNNDLNFYQVNGSEVITNQSVIYIAPRVISQDELAELTKKFKSDLLTAIKSELQNQQNSVHNIEIE